MTTRHDWNMIIREEGDEPLAPSCMPLINDTLDVQESLRWFWKAFEGHFRELGWDSPQTHAYKESGRCDVVTLNLIGNHYGTLITDDHLSAITRLKLEGADLRRFVLMTLLLRGKTTQGNLLKAITMLTSYKSNLLRKYPMSTDKGLNGQMALMQVILNVLDAKNRRIKYQLFSKETTHGEYWFESDSFTEYVLENPEQADRISVIIMERRSADADIVREIIRNDVSALSAGVL